MTEQTLKLRKKSRKFAGYWVRTVSHGLEFFSQTSKHPFWICYMVLRIFNQEITLVLL